MLNMTLKIEHQFKSQSQEQKDTLKDILKWADSDHNMDNVINWATDDKASI